MSDENKKIVLDGYQLSKAYNFKIAGTAKFSKILAYIEQRDMTSLVHEFFNLYSQLKKPVPEWMLSLVDDKTPMQLKLDYAHLFVGGLLNFEKNWAYEQKKNNNISEEENN